MHGYSKREKTIYLPLLPPDFLKCSNEKCESNHMRLSRFNNRRLSRNQMWDSKFYHHPLCCACTIFSYCAYEKKIYMHNSIMPWKNGGAKTISVKCKLHNNAMITTGLRMVKFSKMVLQFSVLAWRDMSCYHVWLFFILLLARLFPKWKEKLYKLILWVGPGHRQTQA